jgi:hypothetical protein
VRFALAAGILLLAAQPATPQVRDAGVARPSGTAVISGVVLTADQNGSPVRLARVTLNSVDRGGPSETGTTDGTGRFTFRGLPAGRYSIQASKRAWLDTNYGESRLGRPGTAVAVRDGERVTNLVMRMTRGAVITGVIRDTTGEPQPGVQVRVLRFVTRDGVRTLERPISTSPNDPVTEDDGVYRAYGLPPGEYVVVAGVRGGASSDRGLGGQEIRPIEPNEVDRTLAGTLPAARSGGTMTYSPVYFPGTTDVGAATTLAIGPGEERAGVDIEYSLLPAGRVLGTTVLSPDLTAARAGDDPKADRRSECRLTPAGFEEVMAQPLAAAITTVGADLKFVFPGVPPGRYTVTCVAGAGGSNQQGAVLGGWADASIVMSGQDQDVTLALGPAAVLNGRVVFEGAAPPQDPAAEVQLVIKPFGRARLLREFAARPQPDGSFRFGAIIPGRWMLTPVLPAKTSWTLKSLTYGGRELDSLIDVSTAGAGLPEVVLTFTDRPSELAGELQEVSGRPATDYFVIVFSTNREAWTLGTRRLQTTRPASDGAFLIRGLPAGEYFLSALTDVEPGEWLSPAFLEQIVAASVKVRVVDGERTQQSLRIAR